MKKNNIIITFDLHEVIFTFDFKKVVRILQNFNHKWAIFTTLFHVPFIFTSLKMVWHNATDEEFYQTFEKKRPILLPLIIEMTNAQKVIPGMEHLIQELHAQGYQLHILSNIGPRRFKQLSLEFPQIINCFDKVQIVQPESNPLKKPDTEFFKHYLSELVDDQHVIFIDDNRKNIEAAKSLGIHAIRFTSANKLRKQLDDLGVL